MLKLYTTLMRAGTPALQAILARRAARGKEDPARLPERMGKTLTPRTGGPVVWFHAASVGEIQSALVLMNAILGKYTQINLLATSGTVTSAALFAGRLPPRTVHQFYPADHPEWVAAFLNHWKPGLALWMESELWPSMLLDIKRRNIPAVLVNARLSERSFNRWRKFAPSAARELLGAFSACLTQTADDAARFTALGAKNVAVLDNLKYAAAPLPFDAAGLDALRDAVTGRPLWLYASTHDGEEDMACRVHAHLKKTMPRLLTVIVPRHPARAAQIKAACEKHGLAVRMRGNAGTLPAPGDDIYIADTLGELGLFYRLSAIACIGRSFSSDGGGGHNPIEAAQLGCAVLHGPHVQNLAHIYDDFAKEKAAVRLENEDEFRTQLGALLADPQALRNLQSRAADFCARKAQVLDNVMAAIDPYLKDCAR